MGRQATKQVFRTRLAAYLLLLQTGQARCQHNSHSLYGEASIEQGYGTYGFTIDADTTTKLICNPTPDPINQAYEYRDGAVDAINRFCTAHDGQSLKRGDASTNINELTFSVTYADDCEGSGTYLVSKDTCVKYLMQTLDSCDASSATYKHGGTLTDIDNCGAFAFHPAGYDVMSCYPQNQDAGYIGGSHVTVTPDVAKDAIAQFCDRSGNGQAYTLDPDNIPSATGFVQDTCTTPGWASCRYYYESDGSRAPTGSLGKFSISMSAEYSNPANKYNCSINLPYEINGDRCRRELSKLIGIEPAGNCVGSDPNQLDLGTFLENADKGCVLWNFWAVATD